MFGRRSETSRKAVYRSASSPIASHSLKIVNGGSAVPSLSRFEKYARVVVPNNHRQKKFGLTGANTPSEGRNSLHQCRPRPLGNLGRVRSGPRSHGVFESGPDI